ncbi:Pr6Pr family membrane protein [Microbacterium sp. 3J1]|uniref:Pr6Pr family membrane protein n=1 Tax=Microbacterium sp. 3J1 TaxID=861269 RepID=UPI000A44C452|nr:Pr6Pr family membrane protein [Microbacterium sp. 3J1]
MPSAAVLRRIAVGRLVVAASVLVVLGVAYVLGIPAEGASPFDYFGYFTNLTCLLAALVLAVTAALILYERPVPRRLVDARAVVVSCIIIVGLVYNVLVPGTGSAPPWVGVTLHVVFPAALVVDWLLVGDRPPLPWSRLWIVLPYPLLWLIVVLIRGVTDGWVPYGFLLPERGAASLLMHTAGLLAALLAAGAAVWALSRIPGAVRSPGSDRQAVPQP